MAMSVDEILRYHEQKSRVENLLAEVAHEAAETARTLQATITRQQAIIVRLLSLDTTIDSIFAANDAQIVINEDLLKMIGILAKRVEDLERESVK
jgi:hypothetical protein